MFTDTISESASWLLDMLFKSTVLLALAGVATLACRRASAAVRHLIWTLAVAGVLLLPVLSALLPAWQVARLPDWHPIPVRMQKSANAPAPTRMSPALPPETTYPSPGTLTAPTATTGAEAPTMSPPGERVEPPGSQTASPMPSPLRPILPWYLWVMLAWGIGTALVLAWWGYGYAVTRRLLNSAYPASPSLAALPAAVAGRQKARVLLSDDITIPMVVGLISPAILLPAQAEDWPEERRRVVLLHELAHIQRGDLPAHLLAQLACAGYWMNPLVWVAARRMCAEREIACDDAVLGTKIKAADYAAHLLAVSSALQERRLAPIAGIAMARSSKVGKRIRGVLDGRRNKRGITRLVGMVIVVSAMMFSIVLAIAQTPEEKVSPLVQRLIDSPIPFPESTYTRIGVISRDGRHVAVTYQDKQGVTHITLDGKAYAKHPATEIIIPANKFFDWTDNRDTTITMSPDGSRLAYVITILPEDSSALDVTFRSRKVVIIDGKRSQEFIQVTLPVFSADSKHVAYAGYADGKWRIWRDRTPGPEFNAIVYHSTDVGARLPSEFIYNQGGFSRDGRHFGYVAARGEQWYVVVDDKEYGPYRSVIGFTFAGNGGGRFTFGYTARYADGTAGLVIDGHEEKGFAWVSGPVFNEDGNDLTFAAEKQGERFVKSGSRMIIYGIVTGAPVLGLDKTQQRLHIAYIAGEKGSTQQHVYLDHVKVYEIPDAQTTAFTVSQSLKFSQDGQSVMFHHNKARHVRGKVNADYSLTYENFAFAPDGTLAVTRKTPDGVVLVYNDRIYPPPAVRIESITFSPRGDLAYSVQRKANDGTKKDNVVSQVYVNGTPGDEYEAILPFQPYNAQRFFFDAPDRFHYFAVKDEVIHRVEVTIPAKQGMQSGNSQSTNTLPVAGAPYYGLVVSVECEQSNPVLFKVIEKNVSERDLRYMYCGFPNNYYYLSLTDAQGRPVEKTAETLAVEDKEVTEISLFYDVTLKPGEEQVRTYNLRQYFKSIPPGNYTL